MCRAGSWNRQFSVRASVVKRGSSSAARAAAQQPSILIKTCTNVPSLIRSLRIDAHRAIPPDGHAALRRPDLRRQRHVSGDLISTSAQRSSSTCRGISGMQSGRCSQSSREQVAAIALAALRSRRTCCRLHNQLQATCAAVRVSGVETAHSVCAGTAGQPAAPTSVELACFMRQLKHRFGIGSWLLRKSAMAARSPPRVSRANRVRAGIDLALK